MSIQKDSRKKCARLLLLTITIFFLLTAGFVFINSDHDCTQGGCVVCQQIQACISVLSSFSGTVSVCVVVGFVLAAFCTAFSKAHFSNRTEYTLIRLKVRLNN